jgi:hypothetical protein
MFQNAEYMVAANFRGVSGLGRPKFKLGGWGGSPERPGGSADYLVRD